MFFPDNLLASTQKKINKKKTGETITKKYDKARIIQNTNYTSINNQPIIMQNISLTQNEHKKTKELGLVASYDIRPGHGAGLFSKEKIKEK